MSDRDVREQNVRAVREGHGANCSSIGSVVDTLFVMGVAGGALLAAVAAALAAEKVTVVGGGGPGASRPEAADAPAAKDAPPDEEAAP